MKKAIFIAVIAVIAALIAASPVRKAQAQHKADAFEQQHPVSIEFAEEEQIEDEKAFAEEILRLVCWEEDTMRRIDSTYKAYRLVNLNLVKDMNQVSGYQSAKELQKAALAVKWKQLRSKLEEETLAALDRIYVKAGDKVPVHPAQQAVIAYYQSVGFSRLRTMSLRAEEYPADEFDDVRPGWGYSGNYDDEWTGPDLLYILWPEEIRQEYEKNLQDAIDGADSSDLDASVRSLDHALEDARGLQSRYGCIISNQEFAEALLSDLKDRRREVQEAEEAARKKAIQDELDRIYSSYSGTYEDPVDPDDHDIDAYYYDYMDEYEDADDAWDGFMDDEDAWDDY